MLERISRRFRSKGQAQSKHYEAGGSIEGGIEVESKPVAGYFRISQARDEMHAPEIYADQIERYCDYRGLRLSRVFSISTTRAITAPRSDPHSGSWWSGARSTQQLSSPKLSRFGRSLKHLTQLFDVFDRDGISLVFLDLGMDTSTSQGDCCATSWRHSRSTRAL
jgi:hypothetical protein